MKDRILQIMQSEGLTNAEFSEKLGISTSSLSHIFNGRNKASLEVVMKISKAYPTVDLHWLIFGTGEMKTQSQGSENPKITANGLDDDENRKENASSADTIPPKEIIREQIKYIEKPHPKITEIRVYFDNGTYEVFKSVE